MGVPTQLSARRGIALPSALFGIVAVTVLALGVVGLADARLRAAKDREASARAVLLADEGVAHGLTILRDSLKGTSMTRLLLGSDGAANTADDGGLAGYTLSSAIDIPVAGRVTARGRYRVQIIDDPADPSADTRADGNLRIVLRCTSATTDGGTAVVDALITGRPEYGVVVDGNLAFSGGATIRGSCGAVHANGNVTASGPNTRLAGLSATGSVSGSYRDTTGASLPTTGGVPSQNVPALDLADLCARADYALRTDGTFVQRATTLTPELQLPATAIARNGWLRTGASPVVWTLTGAAATTGTYCLEGTGNAVLSGNIGVDGSPLRISVIAGGSISLTGTPFIAPASSDSALLVANGDLQISGVSGALSPNYDGLLYATNQCIVSGTARLNASLVCRNRPQTVGATEYGTATTIGGTPTITHTCNGWLNGSPVIKAWYQPAG